MKTLLTLCLALIGLAGFATTKAAASETSPTTLPAAVHVNEVDVVVYHRHHYHHYNHRRYYYRHHHRYYYH